MVVFRATDFDAHVLKAFYDLITENGTEFYGRDKTHAMVWCAKCLTQLKTCSIDVLEILPSDYVAVVHRHLTRADRKFLADCGISSADFEDTYLRLPILINPESDDRYIDRDGRIICPEDVQGFQGFEKEEK